MRCVWRQAAGGGCGTTTLDRGTDGDGVQLGGLSVDGVNTGLGRRGQSRLVPAAVIAAGAVQPVERVSAGHRRAEGSQRRHGVPAGGQAGALVQVGRVGSG